MRFKDVFSIIGPSMIGPSSSHTAGAVRLGRTARRIFGQQPEEVEITLYNSFAETYRGHGTDTALAGGILDYDTDDIRIRDALKVAEKLGVHITFKKGQSVTAHPNTAMLKLMRGDRQDQVIGSSIGGGNIQITSVNEFDVSFSMTYPTLLIFHDDRPGVIAQVTDIVGRGNVNIGYMDVDRKGRHGDALTVIETDEAISKELIDQILNLPTVHRITSADLTSKEVMG